MNTYRIHDEQNPINASIAALADKYTQQLAADDDVLSTLLLSAPHTVEKGQRTQSWAHFIAVTQALLNHTVRNYGASDTCVLQAVSEGSVEDERCWIVTIERTSKDYVSATYHLAIPQGGSIIATALYVYGAFVSKYALDNKWGSTNHVLTYLFTGKHDDELFSLCGEDLSTNVLMTSPDGGAVGLSLTSTLHKAAKSRAADWFGSDATPTHDVGTVQDDTFLEYDPKQVIAAMDILITFSSETGSSLHQNPFSEEVYSYFRNSIYLNTYGANRLGYGIAVLTDFAARVADRRDLTWDETSVLNSILHGYAYDVSSDGSQLRFDFGRVVAAAEFATRSPLLTADEAASAIERAIQEEEEAKQRSRELNELVNQINSKSDQLLNSVRVMRQAAGDEKALELGKALFGADFSLDRLGE